MMNFCYTLYKLESLNLYNMFCIICKVLWSVRVNTKCTIPHLQKPKRTFLIISNYSWWKLKCLLSAINSQIDKATEDLGCLTFKSHTTLRIIILKFQVEWNKLEVIFYHTAQVYRF